jgi:hypothetical protein
MGIAQWLREAEGVTYTESVVAIGIASATFLASSPTRIAIIAFPAPGGYTWTSAAPAVTTSGFQMPAQTVGGAPFMLHMRDVGEFVRVSFRAISLTGAGFDATVIEVFTTLV